MEKKYIIKSSLIPVLGNPNSKKRFQLYIEYVQGNEKFLIEKSNRNKKTLEDLLEKHKSEFEEYNKRIDDCKKKKKEIENLLLIQHNSFVLEYRFLQRFEDKNEIKKQRNHMCNEYNILLRGNSLIDFNIVEPETDFFEGLLMLQYEKSKKYLKDINLFFE
ncbi:8711_t:CDS:1 [Scutellospora calospora]|uniref:8711_t:CDS:1 n=1 Tax=Scutellospora calospora TaxID=85575 RepID=A0ACA9LMX8_9GLOM|nr:8711_t:CDS:1 [Scutellospora calospora]